jgi:hypothetical protein
MHVYVSNMIFQLVRKYAADVKLTACAGTIVAKIRTYVDVKFGYLSRQQPAHNNKKCSHISNEMPICG